MLTLQTMTFPLVTDLSPSGIIQRWKQVERDIRWLEISRIRVADVVNQRSKRGFTRRRSGLIVSYERCGVDACEESRCDRFGITLHTADLSRKEVVWMQLHLLRLA